MKTKITIIGAGAVGATTAYSLLLGTSASEILLIDVNAPKASGEALDMKQATPYLRNCDIYSGDYKDAVGSDIVVITSGAPRKPGQTRLELAQINVNIAKSIADEIVKYAPDALYVIVANPVDIITYAFLKYTGLPKHRVIGSGTMLDTIRLRTRLAEIYHVNQKQIHANVLGEHGDSSFAVWSSATVAGIPLDVYAKCLPENANKPLPYTHEELEEYVKKSGGRIIERKGNTTYGIATSVMNMVKSFSGAESTVLTVSTLLEGEYGLNDVCLSTLALLGSNGIESTIIQPLNDDELARMHASAAKLKEIIAGIKF